MQPRSQSLINVFKKKKNIVPCLILIPLHSNMEATIEDQKMQYAEAPCRETHDKAFLLYARSPLNKDKEKHEVTIVPRTPSMEINEPIMLFCKISISLVI